MKSPNRPTVYLNKGTGNLKILVSELISMWKNFLQETGSCGKKVEDALI